MTLGEKLKFLLKENSMTQEDLAENITITLYEDTNIIKMEVSGESIKAFPISEEFLTFYYEISEEGMRFYRSLAE